MTTKGTKGAKGTKKGGTATKPAAKARGNGGAKRKAPRAQASQTPNQPREPTDMGPNRTGTGTAPLRSARTVAGATSDTSDAKAFYRGHADVLRSYVDGGEPIGTMPPPTRPKGMVKAVADLIAGRKGTVLLDKLGERLAFERSGTRLYELLLLKHDVQGGFVGGPSRGDLLRIRNDEHDHFQLVADVLRELGADPTVMTPCADVAAVSSLGLQKIVGDPRTTLAQALQAIHVAELTDNDGWSMLIELVDAFGHTDLADRFRAAADKEAEHLERVRTWLTAYSLHESGAQLVT